MSEFAGRRPLKPGPTQYTGAPQKTPAMIAKANALLVERALTSPAPLWANPALGGFPDDSSDGNTATIRDNNTAELLQSRDNVGRSASRICRSVASLALWGC